MKPFRLKVRVYNNRLVRAREDLAMTGAEVCRRLGLSAGQVCRFETMHDKAWSEHGTWKPAAMRLAEFYGYSPEYLWPDEIALVRKQAFSLEVAAADVPRLLPPDEQLEAAELRAFAKEAKAHLTWAESRVVSGVVENDETGNDVGQSLGLSHTRVFQIRDKALAKARAHIDRQFAQERTRLR